MSLLIRLRELARRRQRPMTLGARGEQAAERYLRRRCRMVITARGYANHVGEIDLIGVDRTTRPRTVVFVEVKTRTDDRHGLPVEAVDRNKQRQITETALVYLKQYDLLESRARFDVIGVLWPTAERHPEITWYRNAFEPTGKYQLFS